MHRAALAFGVLLLAGCFSDSTPPSGDPPTDGPRSTEGGGPTETIPFEPLPNGTVPQVPAHMVLESCSKWGASHTLLPEAMVPGEVPAGWEETDPASDRTAAIGVEGYTCGKISLGPFERGPIDLLFEFHTKGFRPYDCRSTAGAGDHMLIQVVVSNPEIAAFLNSTYGMPSRFGQFTQTATPLPQGETRTLAWSVEGGGESTVTVPNDGNHGTSEDLNWIWWTRGEGLVRLEMDEQLVAPEYGNQVGYGKFTEPMFMSQIADGNFAGVADYYPEAVTTNTFAFFQDTLCTPPDKGTSK